MNPEEKKKFSTFNEEYIYDIPGSRIRSPNLYDKIFMDKNEIYTIVNISLSIKCLAIHHLCLSSS